MIGIVTEVRLGNRVLCTLAKRYDHKMLASLHQEDWEVVLSTYTKDLTQTLRDVTDSLEGM